MKTTGNNRKVGPGKGKNYDPYYPTDYKIGKKRKKPHEVPMFPTDTKVVTFKEWAGIFIVSLIPLVNIIALIAWSGKNNPRITASVRNYARASLMWTILIYVLGVAAVAVCKFVLNLF